MTRFTRFGSLAFTVVALSTVALVAKERPHRFQGEGQFLPNQIDFIASGSATHLGKFTEVGGITDIQPGSGTGIILITASSILTAANGDELHEEISGELNFNTGVGAATITYVGGTGRFVGATGTATLNLQLGSNGSFTFSGHGILDY